MMNLFDLSAQYIKVAHTLENEEGLTQEEINGILLPFGDDIEDKAINIASIIKNWEMEYDAISEAMQSMDERRNAISSRIDNLIEYLKYNLEACNKTKITKSPHFVISIKYNPSSVLITNESLIGAEYLKYKEVITIDKAKIKSELQQGVVIDGAKLQQLTRIEIK